MAECRPRDWKEIGMLQMDQDELAGTTASEPGVELEPPTSVAAIRHNADAILPVIIEEADAIEAGARLSPRAARVMRAAGVFELGFPASRGGVEGGLADQVELTAAVSAVDASAGWNVGVLNAGGFYAGRLGDEAYAELYPTRDRPTSGSFHPRGRAVRVDGGYLVTGSWGWGSGSYTADHVLGGAEVFEQDGTPVIDATGKPLHLGLWLPKPSLVVADDWQTLGVRGSGSTSYSIVEPAFVPAGHAFDRDAEDDPDAEPLNKSVKLAHFALTGVVLGVAQHLVSCTADYLKERGADATGRQALGEAIGEVDFAYAGVLEIAKRTDDIIFTPGRGLQPMDTARMTAANTIAAGALQRVLLQVIEIASARYILDANPIQRVIRDAMSALAHAGTRKKHLVALGSAALADGRRDYTIADGIAHDREERR